MNQILNINKLRRDIVNGKIDINNINDATSEEIRHLVKKYTTIECMTNEEFDECKELIMILLDYYTYNEDGNVLISDFDYDKLMSNYCINGGELLSHADNIKDPLQTRWSFVVHDEPGIVGTIKKIYDESALIFWWNNAKRFDGVKRFRLAPKDDGVSSAITISGDEKLLLAVTRNDGYKGQDITKVVERIPSLPSVIKRYKKKMKPGEIIHIKTEIVMSTHAYKKCIEEKNYANRRSATIGIVNSPKNLHLARYLDIIPLASMKPNDDFITYKPVGSYILDTDSPYELLKEIYSFLSLIRDASFSYRTDGVVIFPMPYKNDDWEKIKDFNPLDIMDSAIAFKVNTNEGLTTVEYGYVSVGPLGYARPMLHVKPVEVNETIVRDVSLGSFDIFASMDLHEGEQVVVFSAGDVIPQARLPENRNYKLKAKMIKIKKKCPFCGEKLNRDRGTYRCENENCPRVNQGRIINFITKLKVRDIAEATINDLYEHNLIKTIPDIFKLTKEDILSMEGYQDAKASLVVSEFQKLRIKEVTISELLGALGIKGISTKKCRKILDALGDDYKQIFKKNPENLFFELTNGEGVGDVTASVFIDFLKENQKLINKLIDKMNIVIDKQYNGNVVFTGFRDPELEEEFLTLGYEVSSAVTNKTKAVINASYDYDSSKCQAAIRKGVTIVHRSKVDDILKELSQF